MCIFVREDFQKLFLFTLFGGDLYIYIYIGPISAKKGCFYNFFLL